MVGVVVRVLETPRNTFVGLNDNVAEIAEAATVRLEAVLQSLVTLLASTLRAL